jgi:hypothetical protein
MGTVVGAHLANRRWLRIPPRRAYATKVRDHPVQIDKAEIIATLRSRGLQDRADWVDRTLPQLVDTYKNGALLRMLGLDSATMTPVDVASRSG